MQTVSGVERIRPGHPQRSVQKMAMASRARDEMPVRELKSQGSTKLVAVRPSVTKRAMTKSGGPQEGDEATETTRGNARAVVVPTYGMMRSIPASTPQRVAFGIPMRKRPKPKR